MFLALAAALFFCSCDSDDRFSGLRSGTKSNFEPLAFPPVKDCKVSLEITSKRTDFYAGEEATLTVRLKNIGEKPIVVYEWMVNESDNVKISYAPYMPGVTPVASAWKCDEPKLEKHIKRAPLTLNPGNSAIINVPITFLSSLGEKDLGGGSKLFMLSCELNLKSVTARSAPFPITVK